MDKNTGLVGRYSGWGVQGFLYLNTARFEARGSQSQPDESAGDESEGDESKGDNTEEVEEEEEDGDDDDEEDETPPPPRLQKLWRGSSKSEKQLNSPLLKSN